MLVFLATYLWRIESIDYYDETNFDVSENRADFDYNTG